MQLKKYAYPLLLLTFLSIATFLMAVLTWKEPKISYPENHLQLLPTKPENTLNADNGLNMCVRIAGTVMTVFVPTDSTVGEEAVRGYINKIPFQICVTEAEEEGIYKKAFSNMVVSVPTSKPSIEEVKKEEGFLYSSEASYIIHRIEAQISVRNGVYYMLTYEVKMENGRKILLSTLASGREELTTCQETLDLLASTLRPYEESFVGVEALIKEEIFKTGDESFDVEDVEAEEPQKIITEEAAESVTEESLPGFSLGEVGEYPVEENIQINTSLEFAILLLAWENGKLPVTLDVYKEDGSACLYAPELSCPDYLCFKLYSVSPSVFKVRGTAKEPLSHAFAELYDAEDFYTLYME